MTDFMTEPSKLTSSHQRSTLAEHIALAFSSLPTSTQVEVVLNLCHGCTTGTLMEIATSLKIPLVTNQE